MDLDKVKVLSVSPGKIRIARREILLTNVPDEDKGNLRGHTMASFEDNEDGSLSLFFEDEESKEKAHEIIKRMKVNKIVSDGIKIKEKEINVSRETEDFIERLSSRVKTRTEAEEMVKKGRIPLTHEEIEDKIKMVEKRLAKLETKK